MKIIYNLSIYLYYTLIFTASLFSNKAKLWIRGRKNIFDTINNKLQNETSKTVWIHCASLGEFEQGRTIIEAIKTKQPELKIVLTFFSPSGYEIRKNYSGADYIFYLPMDTPSHAAKFISLVRPTVALFVKYEFWFNYLNELKKQNIPTYLVSGIFREDHYFFKGYATWFRKQLKNFSHFFVQNETSNELLKSIGYSNVTISGDTRFDRVRQIAEQTKEFEKIKKFCNTQQTIIAGSTWAPDEKILASYDFKKHDCKLIIAPHEIDEHHLSAIEELFKKENTIRYSIANEDNVSEKNILIVDNIGMLSSLYKYGNIAYIGGGFGAGIHNILEAATFGMPIIFGPNYKKFNEAKDLIQSRGAFSINSKEDFLNTIAFLKNKEEQLKCAKICKHYVEKNIGATDIILKSIHF